MTSRRMLKAAEAIREVVASAILTEIRDPRVKDVTVIAVEVTPDMREAKVFVSVMGDEPEKQRSLKGLQNSAGFLQSKIARRIDSRYTPRLQFELHRGMENALVVGELLGKIHREQQSPDAEQIDAEQIDAEQIDAGQIDAGQTGGGAEDEPPMESDPTNPSASVPESL